MSQFVLLPLIDGAYTGQHRDFDTTPSIVLTALQEAFDEIVALNSDLLIEPLAGYVRQVIHHHTPGATPIFYDKANWETVYLVDTNGDVYSYGNAYDAEFCHGNIFHDPMQRILPSPGHQRAIETAAARMTEVCSSCRFFGTCSGYAIAEEAPLQQRHGESLACNIDRPMLEFVEHRLKQLGAIDPDRKRFVGLAESLSHIAPVQLSLQRDVRIRIDVPDEMSLNARIALSAGTTNKIAQPDDGLDYISAAVVPRSPFRSATRYETELLLADTESPWHIGRDIAVVRIPDDVISPLMQIFEDFGTSQTLENYRDHTSHPAWPEAYGRLSDYVEHHHALDAGAPRIVRLGNSLPGKVTVTKDTVRGHHGVHYVGMHVDSWVDVPLHERDQSQKRMCINLGRGARQFLFMALQEIEWVILGHFRVQGACR